VACDGIPAERDYVLDKDLSLSAILKTYVTSRDIILIFVNEFESRLIGEPEINGI
jgi:hypothetical protein